MEEVFNKVVALGNVFIIKGGREAVTFMLSQKGVTRAEIMENTGIGANDMKRIIAVLKSGDLVEIPKGYGTMIRLNPHVKTAMNALAKPVEPEPSMVVKKGKMVAQFTKYDKKDPIIEGTCGKYAFTAIMKESSTSGVWGTCAEHFVMRDTETQQPMAKHDPELGWTLRPNNPEKIKHLKLVEFLFKNAPKFH